MCISPALRQRVGATRAAGVGSALRRSALAAHAWGWTAVHRVAGRRSSAWRWAALTRGWSSVVGMAGRWSSHLWVAAWWSAWSSWAWRSSLLAGSGAAWSRSSGSSLRHASLRRSLVLPILEICSKSCLELLVSYCVGRNTIITG